MSKIQTFEATSTEPYDRHSYTLVYKTGQKFKYDSWERVQMAWFNMSRLGNLSHVEVLEKGFS